MSQQLVSHSPDLKRLQEEGYEIEINSGFLIVRHIPYVNASRQIAFGVLISELTLSSNTTTTRPSNHVIYFQGEQPCDKQGVPIAAIMHAMPNQTLFPGVVGNYSFSNKPQEGYGDYYHKIKTYSDIISAPAKSIDDTVTEKTFKVLSDSDNISVFHYIDSNSSRANISTISQKLTDEKIAIIGLGGTGSYILDLIAKCPVQEIHLFDGDNFLQHNAFRSPGAASIEILDKHFSKVEYYKSVYSNMHKAIFAHQLFIDEDSLESLRGMTCVFISIDRGSVKARIIEFLISQGTRIIDVGLGVERVDDSLIGTLRVTSMDKLKNDHVSKRISLSDDPNAAYNSNIQIAELNSLNAALAVIKWKKWVGFYNDLEHEYHTTYSVNVSQLLNDEIGA